MGEGGGKDDLAGPRGTGTTLGGALAAPFSGRGSTAQKPRFCQLWNVEFCSPGQLRTSQQCLNLLSPAED